MQDAFKAMEEAWRRFVKGRVAQAQRMTRFRGQCPQTMLLRVPHPRFVRVGVFLLLGSGLLDKVDLDQTLPSPFVTHLHPVCMRAFLGLADQEMNVFRHHQVAHQRKPALRAYFGEYLDEQIAGASGAQQREPPVAGAGNEMEVAGTVAASQALSHENRTAHPSENKRTEG